MNVSPDSRRKLSAFAPIAVSFLLLVLLCGCHSAPKLPPVNLQSAGWTVRQGQAVWTAKRGEEGVAGELLLATRADGACFVQFSKPPFTLATARAEAGGWAVELQSGHRAFGGQGKGPTQFIWFALVEALNVGQASRLSPSSTANEIGDRRDACPTPWQFDALDGERWQLTNRVTGERLEGYLSP